MNIVNYNYNRAVGTAAGLPLLPVNNSRHTSSLCCRKQGLFWSTPSITARKPASFKNKASKDIGPEHPPDVQPAQSDDETPPINVFSRASISAQDVYFYVNAIYWSLLVVSVITGQALLQQIAHFGVYVSVMLAASAAFTVYFAVRWVLDVRQHKAEVEQRRDKRVVSHFAFNTVFWLGFVLWYLSSPDLTITDITATSGAIMCLFGAALSASAAITSGFWSFLGEPQAPKRLSTSGPYALLRHPQALGNFLALIGFSLAGGALAASAAFFISFVIYALAVIPKEERMLHKTFGAKYAKYCEQVPKFAWALLLLIIVEGVLLWRYAPFSLPIGPPPTPFSRGFARV